MKRLGCATSLLTLFLLTGCVSSDYMAVGDTTYAPRAADWAIDVFIDVEAPVALLKCARGARSPDLIPAGAQLIGRVDTEGSSLSSWDELIDDAREKARALGGDALVIGSWHGHLHKADPCCETDRGKLLSASVIRFR